MRFLLSVIIYYWVSGIALAADLPPYINVEYVLSGRIGQGKAHETLSTRKENGIEYYLIRSKISASGLLSLIKRGSILRHSEGTIIPLKGMRPLHFTDQRGGKPVREVEFNWNEQRILYRRKGREITEDLPDGTQDELSLAYHFMFAPPPTQQVLLVHETDYRKLRTVRYTVTYETLDTPIGTLATIALTKQQEPGDSLRKKIWLATDHHLLPVRIIATNKNGLEIDQTVTKINYTPDSSVP